MTLLPIPEGVILSGRLCIYHISLSTLSEAVILPSNYERFSTTNGITLGWGQSRQKRFQRRDIPALKLTPSVGRYCTISEFYDFNDTFSFRWRRVRDHLWPKFKYASNLSQADISAFPACTRPGGAPTPEGPSSA